MWRNQTRGRTDNRPPPKPATAEDVAAAEATALEEEAGQKPAKKAPKPGQKTDTHNPA